LSGELHHCKQPEPSVYIPLLYTRNCENGKQFNTAENVARFILITIYLQDDEIKAVQINGGGVVLRAWRRRQIYDYGGKPEGKGPHGKPGHR
jgi:hypothetical protein